MQGDRTSMVQADSFNNRVGQQRIGAANPTRELCFAFILTIPLFANGGQSIFYDPYATVDWQTTLRHAAQFHDHSNSPDTVRAYDAAGYGFGSYFQYSGNPTLSHTWKEYRWPVDDWLGEGFSASLENLTLFPNVEQIGPQHWTSPWIETYIEYQPDGTEDYQYATTEEGFALARENGGLPILAHPWHLNYEIEGMHAVEIYSGYVLYKWRIGDYAEDRNAWLVDYWDEKLKENPRLFGVAVNDWLGPFADRHFTDETKWAQDTGKQILLTPEKTSAAAKEAFRVGAMFALVDKGRTKGDYPDVLSIDVGETFIRVNTDDNVRWISSGEEIANGPYFDLGLVGNRNHVRAEISNDSSVLYTQP